MGRRGQMARIPSDDARIQAMLSLTYASRPLIPRSDRARCLADIQVASVSRNSMLDLTGVLIASAEHFMQVLEGPDEAVEHVMASILADPRHHDLRVVRRIEAERRQYARWYMARFESASFGRIAITPLLGAVHARQHDAVRRMDRLMEALVHDEAAAPSQAPKVLRWRKREVQSARSAGTGQVASIERVTPPNRLSRAGEWP